MNTPAKHLPGPISDDALNKLLAFVDLPKASQIISTNVTAEYHSICIITLLLSNKASHMNLVLQVSGHHPLQIKMVNEIGIMSRISKNTMIPVPDVIVYDASVNNPIAHKYTLLSCVEGETLSNIYTTLNEEQISGN